MYNVVLDSDVLQSDSVIHTCVPSPQSRATLWDPMYYSPPGSSGIEFFQARILEWGTISYSRASSWPRDCTHLSSVSCIGRWILYH